MLSKTETFVNGNGPVPSKAPLSPLQQYAKEISLAADAITEYCSANNLPQPSLNPEASTVKIPANAPVDIHEARQKLTSCATTVQQVVTEPAEYLPHLSIQVSLETAIRTNMSVDGHAVPSPGLSGMVAPL